jgi:hypothetical protein
MSSITIRSRSLSILRILVTRKKTLLNLFFMLLVGWPNGPAVALRIHFGLGNHDRVERAEILWPNGTKDTLTNLTADRFYLVREGQGVVLDKASEQNVKLP